VTPNFESDNVRTPNVETTASASAVPRSLIAYFEACTNDDNDKQSSNNNDDDDNDDDGLSLDEEPDDTLVADVVLPEHEDEVVDDDECKKILPDKDEVIISEVVTQMNITQSSEKDNPQDDGLEYHFFPQK